ncbi:hypothetical protein JOC77_002192 [Peribacillus deserti]|uniref:Uncharacterized protein n=1 Tax=Peribacillus deserti TaxID=673318 RepID=A0ABS2QHW2_9BACI|nr:hypothetical protein [Peribacillus deserti]MBM7692761.1 hypothetical protein [Peribacillus deserti]
MNQSNSLRLSPPQFTYFNEVKNSIGKDPLVNVKEIKELPNGEYLIPVIVQGSSKARALAAILENRKHFGNIVVNTVVIVRGKTVKPLKKNFTPRQLEELFDQALNTNRYFKMAVSRSITPGTIGLFPVFSKRVIQFFNDDLSDLYNNFNGVAANVFRDVLKAEINNIPINPSTASEK